METRSPARSGFSICLVAALCFSCRADSGSGTNKILELPRARLFAAAGQDDGLAGILSGGSTRLFVLFTPNYGRCTPETAAITRALRKIGTEYPDMRIFTLRPASLGTTTTAYGERLPGEMLTISDAAYRAQDAVAPNPRLEVWTGERERRLLLMRSLPRVVTENEIYAEVLWARSFTGVPSNAGS